MARRPVPPILRQKMPWPKGRDPIGAEVPILLKEAEERVAAIYASLPLNKQSYLDTTRFFART